jgi:hypothetical protein
MHCVQNASIYVTLCYVYVMYTCAALTASPFLAQASSMLLNVMIVGATATSCICLNTSIALSTAPTCVHKYSAWQYVNISASRAP